MIENNAVIFSWFMSSFRPLGRVMVGYQLEIVGMTTGYKALVHGLKGGCG